MPAQLCPEDNQSGIINLTPIEKPLKSFQVTSSQDKLPKPLKRDLDGAGFVVLESASARFAFADICIPDLPIIPPDIVIAWPLCFLFGLQSPLADMRFFMPFRHLTYPSWRLLFLDDWQVW